MDGVDAADDRSGNTLADLATTGGHRIAVRQIAKDDWIGQAKKLVAAVAV